MALALLIPALVPACGPKIRRFDVVPVRMCVGESVLVAYSVRGNPQLEILRRGGPPEDTTTYTLMVTRHGKVAFARKDVIAFWPTGETVLAFDTHLVGPDSIASVDTLSPERWSASLRMETAASLSGRAIRITHADRTVLLPADGTASDAVRDLPLAGRWDLIAPLLPGESAGGGPRAPPAALDVRVQLCGAGAPGS